MKKELLNIKPNPLVPYLAKSLRTSEGRLIAIKDMKDCDVVNTHNLFSSEGVELPKMLSERYYAIMEINS